MGFPKKREEMLRAVVDAYEQQPDDVYWCRRLLAECVDERDIAEHRALVAPACATWISFDPAWFVHAIAFHGEVHSHLWPKDLLEEIESLLTLENASLKHLILGRLWWEARLRREEDGVFAERAAEHFRRVEPLYQIGRFHELFGEALALVDPAQLEAHAPTFLASVSPFGLANARHTLLEAAARAKNWAAYDDHRALYRSMQDVGHTHGHLDCRVLDLDGVVALERKRDAEIPGILAELVRRGANVEFLAAKETTRLVRALVPRGEHLEACRAYLRMIQKQRPSTWIAKILADVEVAMVSKRRSHRNGTRKSSRKATSQLARVRRAVATKKKR